MYQYARLSVLDRSSPGERVATELRDRFNASFGPQRHIPDSAVCEAVFDEFLVPKMRHLRSFVAGEDAGEHEAPNIRGRCRIDEVAVADGVGQRGVLRRMS